MAEEPFLLPADPKAGYLAHKQEIDAAVQRVLESGRYILGREVTDFQQEFAAYHAVQDAVGTGSGTDALQLALRVCRIGEGDGVVTVSHTASATVAAIELAGAAPVLVDIDPRTFTMDPNCVEETIRAQTHPRIKAILPVHLYGHPVDMPAIMEIAQRHSLIVIEDCAQSHGAAIGGRKTGCWGQMAAFSFYPTKNLGALGDAGALLTDDRELAQRARFLQQYGWQQRYISEVRGMNTRLDEMQAAILRVKLSYLDDDNSRRRAIAGLYDALLSQTRLVLPESYGNVTHVFHQYTARAQGRDALCNYLKANAVGTAILYPVPIHLQPAYRGRVAIGAGGLHHTESVCRELACLPIYPQLADESVERICDLIHNWHDGRTATLNG